MNRPPSRRGTRSASWIRSSGGWGSASVLTSASRSWRGSWHWTGPGGDLPGVLQHDDGSGALGDTVPLPRGGQQIYMLGCAPARDEQGFYVSYSNSIVVSPWGEVLGPGWRE